MELGELMEMRRLLGIMLSKVCLGISLFDGADG